MIGNRDMLLASNGQDAHELLERLERGSELKLELHLREALEVYKCHISIRPAKRTNR
jgi:hypothetical protein